MRPRDYFSRVMSSGLQVYLLLIQAFVSFHARWLISTMILATSTLSKASIHPSCASTSAKFYSKRLLEPGTCRATLHDTMGFAISVSRGTSNAESCWRNSAVSALGWRSAVTRSLEYEVEVGPQLRGLDRFYIRIWDSEAGCRKNNLSRK